MYKKPLAWGTLSAPTHFIGIDISQEHLDVALRSHSTGGATEALRIDNNKKGLRQLERHLRKAGYPITHQTLVVAENTGLYGRPLVRFCQALGLALHLGNATELNRSFGIARGKSDRIDAERLCDYALRHYDRLQVLPAVSEAVWELKDLYAVRRRLIKQKTAHQNHLTALKRTSLPAVVRTMEAVLQPAIQGLKAAIKAVELELKTLIRTDEGLWRNYTLLLSVPGVGAVTAWYLLGCTLNFSIEVSGRSLACYCGVAPFERTSGSSIRGRARVHHMGNKELKTLLHQGARSLIQHKEEFKEYYQRKIQEGKHELTVVNNIKNKILHRVAAIIKAGEKYVDKPLKAA